MVKPLIHDPEFLAVPSVPATDADLPVAQDQLDTLTAYTDSCVGMAANMIGVSKQIICFNNKGEFMTMLNPQLIKKLDEYETEESCLSLVGGPRKTKRYRQIRVRYLTLEWKEREKTFTGFTAQIIQLELDHCEGILI
ncbi:MAG: peptide deformylase [Clostridia bacterium]|nr:peptide deformylase [Clostridia bacterium]